MIQEKAEFLKNVLATGNLEIISQEKSTVNGKQAYVTNARGFFQSNGESYNVQFREVIIATAEKFYTFAYSNGVDNFNDQISRFEDSVNSFKIISEPTKETNSIIDDFSDKGGCLIATATYGSELASQVQQLRELRDNTILTTQSGTAFMTGFNQLYYLFSPTIADYEREQPIFKEAIKLTLTPMLTTLSILNYVDIDSEQEMLGYGIGIILMNVGMYFVAPAMIIQRLRK